MSARVDGSGAMFDRIADRYDMLNRIMSLGMDRGWRKQLVRSLDAGPDACFLDVATGTADVALALAKTYPTSTVVGLDASQGMIDVGRGKVTARALDDRIELLVGDAQAMPFETDRFHGACIAFGIRNVPDRALGISEMARVTRPGGKVSVLELGEPRQGFMAPLARFHVHTVVPRLGSLLSGSDEYDYLQRSIAAFPPADVFCELMRTAGLRDVTVKPFAFGAAHLYIGTV